MSRRDAGQFGIGNGGGRAEIRVGDAVVPGEFVFVPLRPEITEEESSRREQVTGGAKKKLAGRRFFAGKVHDAQAAQHHPRSGTAKHSEERKILDIDDGKGSGVNGRGQLAESEVAAERAEERKKSATGEEQASGINKAGETPFVHE